MQNTVLNKDGTQYRPPMYQKVQKSQMCSADMDGHSADICVDPMVNVDTTRTVQSTGQNPVRTSYNTNAQWARVMALVVGMKLSTSARNIFLLTTGGELEVMLY